MLDGSARTNARIRKPGRESHPGDLALHRPARARRWNDAPPWGAIAHERTGPANPNQHGAAPDSQLKHESPAFWRNASKHARFRPDQSRSNGAERIQNHACALNPNTAALWMFACAFGRITY
jgi:hypothetical protein